MSVCVDASRFVFTVFNAGVRAPGRLDAGGGFPIAGELMGYYLQSSGVGSTPTPEATLSAMQHGCGSVYAATRKRTEESAALQLPGGI